MLEKNKDIEEIIEITELTKEEIEKLLSLQEILFKLNFT